MTSDDHRPTEAGHPSQSEALRRYRSDIEDLDRRILHLVGERLDLAKQIGRLKSRTRAPLRNFEVEAEVHRRFADGCRDETTWTGGTRPENDLESVQ